MKYVIKDVTPFDEKLKLITVEHRQLIVPFVFTYSKEHKYLCKGSSTWYVYPSGDEIEIIRRIDLRNALDEFNVRKSITKQLIDS